VGEILVLSAAQGDFHGWIPAFAGMTVEWIIWVYAKQGVG
jgi:hypothetical protein